MTTSAPSTGAIVRHTVGGATIVFGIVGFLHGADPRWLGASALLGAVWTLWDLLVDQLIRPLGDWFMDFAADGGAEGDDGLRPTPEDTIRLLEHHVAHGASRHVEIQSALRLAELYETVRHDSASAKRVIATVRARYPDAPELERFSQES